MCKRNSLPEALIFKENSYCKHVFIMESLLEAAFHEENPSCKPLFVKILPGNLDFLSAPGYSVLQKAVTADSTAKDSASNAEVVCAMNNAAFATSLNSALPDA